MENSGSPPKSKSELPSLALELSTSSGLDGNHRENRIRACVDENVTVGSDLIGRVVEEYVSRSLGDPVAVRPVRGGRGVDEFRAMERNTVNIFPGLDLDLSDDVEKVGFEIGCSGVTACVPDEKHGCGVTDGSARFSEAEKKGISSIVSISQSSGFQVPSTVIHSVNENETVGLEKSVGCSLGLDIRGNVSTSSSDGAWGLGSGKCDQFLNAGGKGAPSLLAMQQNSGLLAFGSAPDGVRAGVQVGSPEREDGFCLGLDIGGDIVVGSMNTTKDSKEQRGSFHVFNSSPVVTREHEGVDVWGIGDAPRVVDINTGVLMNLENEKEGLQASRGVVPSSSRGQLGDDVRHMNSAQKVDSERTDVFCPRMSICSGALSGSVNEMKEHGGSLSKQLFSLQMNEASPSLMVKQGNDSLGYDMGLDGTVESRKDDLEESKGAYGSGNNQLDSDEVEEDGTVGNMSLENVEDDTYDFCVGDFVWGKIRSHPWWPGQIYDPEDASDYANSVKQTDKILVAYFGDGTFAWCNPSQLKPFDENFADTARLSTSKNFLNALRETLDVVGRLVTFKMTCSCMVKNKFDGDHVLCVANAGLRDGTPVPPGGIKRLLPGFPEPLELLSLLKGIAQLAVVPDMLELAILKGWLSAFYAANGQSQMLASFSEPQSIPDAEFDDEGNWIIDSDGVGFKIKGPAEEEEEEEEQEEEEEEEEEVVEEEEEEDWLASPRPFQLVQTSQSMMLQRCEAVSRERTYQRRKQKSITDIMVGNDPHPHEECEVAREAQGGNKPWPRRGRKKKVTAGGEETIENSFSEENAHNCLETENGAASRKRKKSKYLSHPYTDLQEGMRKQEFEEELERTPHGTQFGERMIRAATQIFGSSPLLKSGSDGNYPRSSVIELSTDSEQSGNSTLRASNSTLDLSDIINAMHATTPTNEMLSMIRSAAVDPRNFKINTSLGRFFMALRNTTFQNGPYYKFFHKTQKSMRKKRKSLDLEHGSWGDNTVFQDDKPRGRRGKGIADNHRAQVATLLVSFGPGSTLPSKLDLVNIYGEFGPLKEDETEMFHTNYCARIVFLSSYKAIEAFHYTQYGHPFGLASVSLKLQYVFFHNNGKQQLRELSSPTTITPSEQRLKNALGQGAVAIHLSDLNRVKQKLEMVVSMLQSSDPNAADLKSRVEEEVRRLVERVGAMVESSVL